MNVDIPGPLLLGPGRVSLRACHRNRGVYFTDLG